MCYGFEPVIFVFSESLKRNKKFNLFSRFRWFPEVQNIYYQGNKRKQVPSNQDEDKLRSFFDCAATLMTSQLQSLCLLSISDYTDLLVQPTVSVFLCVVILLALFDGIYVVSC